MKYTKNPKKKTTKKVYKKTNGYKPKPNNSMYPRSTVNVGLGFPKKMLVKQKYVETVFMTSTVGSLSNYVFSLNGMYDPNITGTGHQPLYFDQYMAIYNHYTVIGSKITVTFVPYEDNQNPLRVALWQNDDATITNSSIDFLQEQSISRSTVLGSGGDSKVTKSFKWSPKKTFGGAILNNSLLRGDVTTNPTEQSYGVMSIQSANFTSNNNCTCLVSIEYLVIYSELKDIASS